MPPKIAQQRLPFISQRQQAIESSSTVSEALSQVLNDSDTAELSAGPNRRKITAKTKGRTSWIYSHMPDDDRNTLYKDTEGRIEWRCRYCPQKYLLNGGTSIITNHLIQKHEL